MKDLKTEIKHQCASMIESLSAQWTEESLDTLGLLHEQILAAVTEQLELCYQKLRKPTDRLSAQTVTLEFKDEGDKSVYRRTLPLEYVENDNGIVLTGEDIHGAAASIAFLSASAVEKISALTGKGWQNPRCNHENEG